MSKGKYKYVQGIKCPKCGEKFWSRHRHDFRYCSCGYCYVDGGRAYLRCGWGGDEFPKPWPVPDGVRIRVPLTEFARDAQYEQQVRWPY